MQGLRSIAARFVSLPVAGAEAKRSLFTAASSTALAEMVGSIGFSSYSTDSISAASAPKGCLMYLGGVCQLSDQDLEESDCFLAANPILQKVSQRGLIFPRPGKDYVAAEGGKFFIWNALLLPHILHSNKISVKGLFEEQNVAVIRNLGILAFRDINPPEKDELTEDVQVEGIVEALSWVKRKTLQSMGIEMADLPKEVQVLFNYLLDSPVDIKKILTDVSLLPRESRGILIMRIYGVLKKLLSRAIVNSKLSFRQNEPLQQKVDKVLNYYPSNDPDAANVRRVNKFYEELPYTELNRSKGPKWTENVDEPNSFLKPFVGKMGGQKLLLGPEPDGKGIMHIHRNGVVHWMDEEIARLIQQVAAAEGISIPDHTLGDVLDLLQYEFPEFLQVAVSVFKSQGWLPHLGLWSLFTGPKCLPK